MKRQQIFVFTPNLQVLNLQKFNRYLNKLSAHCDIKDKTGKQWHFTSHQFRRTVATKMTNEQVRQYIIQCYLRHQSPDMLKHYAELLPDTIHKEPLLRKTMTFLMQFLIESMKTCIK